MNSLRVLLKKEGDKMPPAQNATANSNTSDPGKAHYDLSKCECMCPPQTAEEACFYAF